MLKKYSVCKQKCATIMGENSTLGYVDNSVGDKFLNTLIHHYFESGNCSVILFITIKV